MILAVGELKEQQARAARFFHVGDCSHGIRQEHKNTHCSVYLCALLAAAVITFLILAIVLAELVSIR